MRKRMIRKTVTAGTAVFLSVMLPATQALGATVGSIIRNTSDLSDSDVGGGSDSGAGSAGGSEDSGGGSSGSGGGSADSGGSGGGSDSSSGGSGSGNSGGSGSENTGSVGSGSSSGDSVGTGGSGSSGSGSTGTGDIGNSGSGNTGSSGSGSSGGGSVGTGGSGSSGSGSTGAGDSGSSGSGSTGTGGSESSGIGNAETGGSGGSGSGNSGNSGTGSDTGGNEDSESTGGHDSGEEESGSAGENGQETGSTAETTETDATPSKDNDKTGSGGPGGKNGQESQSFPEPMKEEPKKSPLEGDGTVESPYLIKTYKDLEKMAELAVEDYETYGNSCYRLTQNIQMKKGRNNHKPIGSREQPFMGELDGDGYVISGLRISRPSKEAQGLFASIGAEGTVRNLGLSENSICGQEDVGAIAGINYGTIEACFQTGEVYGVKDRVGSMAGRNSGTISNCYSTGPVYGGYKIGDYIPESAGEEKGRYAGRGGFRDFIMTVAETFAETIAETVAFIVEETKAGLETLYEIVTTTLSPEPESDSEPWNSSQDSGGPGAEDSLSSEPSESREPEDLSTDESFTESIGSNDPAADESSAEDKEPHGSVADEPSIENSRPNDSATNDSSPESQEPASQPSESSISDSRSSEHVQDQTTAAVTAESQEASDNQHMTDEQLTPEDTIGELQFEDEVELEDSENSSGPALGGIVGDNEGGVIENCYQAGRQAVKTDRWTAGGITGVNRDGLLDNCYYVAANGSSDSTTEEFDGVTAVSVEFLSGESSVEQLGLDMEWWVSLAAEADDSEDESENEPIRYRHYYPQLTVFAEKGQPYPYTLGFFEADGLRVDTLTKKAYLSTEEAWNWLFDGTDYLDYEIVLEADLDLTNFHKSIGTMEQPFTGILDGDGHVITGLKQPLFHVLGDGSAVYYLLLDQADIRQMAAHESDEYSSAANVCGVLAGYSRNAVIDSCGAVGMIKLSAGGSNGRPVYIGGLIGEAAEGTSIYESYAFVNIAENLGDGARVSTGGLTGLMGKNAGADNCYATGRLESGGTVGGLAGKNRGEIRDSFVTTIIGNMAKRSGAFVGQMLASGERTEREFEVQSGETAALQETAAESAIDESEVSAGEGEDGQLPLQTGDKIASGEEQWIKQNGAITGCAYDIQMSGSEDQYAQAMTTGEMTGESAAMPGGDWYTTEGAYPQLKCMALHTHETYILRSKASAIPLILPHGIYISDIPETDSEEETESEIKISGSVEMGVPAQIDGDEISWSGPDRVKLQGDGTAVLEMD